MFPLTSLHPSLWVLTITQMHNKFMHCLGRNVKVLGCVSSFLAIVFTSWQSLTFADAKFRRQRSGGSWRETRPVLSLSPPLFIHSFSTFSLNTLRGRSGQEEIEKKTDDMDVNQQSWKNKKQHRDSDTGNHLTSRPHPHPNHVLRHPSAHVYPQRKLSEEHLS